MIDAATIDAMLASGCTAEQIGAVVKAGLAADAARAEALRHAAAERKRRSRQRRAGHAMSRDVTLVTVTSRDICDIPASSLPPPCPPSSPSPDTPNPTIPLNPPSALLHPTGGERWPNPVLALQSILDPLNARRFADHCAGKGRRLSAEQAEAIVAELRAVRDAGGNPVEAINLAIGRGWTSIRREWLAGGSGHGGPQATARASPGRLDVAGVFDDLAAEMGLSDVRKRGEPAGTLADDDAAIDPRLLGPVRRAD